MMTKNKDVAQLLKSELYNEPTLPPTFQPKTPSIIDIPKVLEVKANDQVMQINLEKPLDPAIRYGMIQGANELNGLANAEIHPVWVGGSQARTLEVSSLNTRYISVRWIDHFGRIVQTQVYQIP